MTPKERDRIFDDYWKNAKMMKDFYKVWDDHKIIRAKQLIFLGAKSTYDLLNDIAASMELAERWGIPLHELKKRCLSILNSKGEEYSGNQDIHKNFKEIGAQLRIDPLSVLYVYKAKHIYSLQKIAETGKSTEPTIDRLADDINYAVLAITYLIERGLSDEDN